jgi:hypothetical protein
MSHAEKDYDPAAAAEFCRGVVANEPENGDAWYYLGFAHMCLHNWRESADANLRAVALRSQPDDAAWWNLGIAATALRDWELARRAWRGYGIDATDLPDGSGPIELIWNRNPVRIFSDDRKSVEVVWGRRICPARIKIESIPFPASGHRWGDIVLHDGAENGERTTGGQTYPVFDELVRWSPSEIPTLRADVRCASDADSHELSYAFEDAKFSAEDWSTSVRQLCKECSEQELSMHDHSFPEGSEERVFGIAAPMGIASRVLRAWREASPATRDFSEPEAVG